MKHGRLTAKENLTGDGIAGRELFIHNQSFQQRVFYLLAASQVHQVQFSTQFLLRLHVLLLDVDQEDAVAARTVLVHVWTKTEEKRPLVGQKKAVFVLWFKSVFKPAFQKHKEFLKWI